MHAAGGLPLLGYDRTIDRRAREIARLRAEEHAAAMALTELREAIAACCGPRAADCPPALQSRGTVICAACRRRWVALVDAITLREEGIAGLIALRAACVSCYAPTEGARLCGYCAVMHGEEAEEDGDETEI